jgi:hypothetical protein
VILRSSVRDGRSHVTTFSAEATPIASDLLKLAQRFGKREKVADQKTLDILKTVQQQIPSEAEIALL